MAKYYITTAIAYINGRPHIGHALEFIFADIFARYRKLVGFDTYLLTGTDEHGSKFFKLAKSRGVDIRDLAAENVKPFYKLCEAINMDYSQFIRTSSEFHKRGARKLWKMLEESGDIYKDYYSGMYCSGCEAYCGEKDLVDGKCPIHKIVPDSLEEENYFFRLSKYSDQIKSLIESDELKIYPDRAKSEMLAFCERGLTDVSFSRPKDMLPWGVEVPGDKNHVMYVWCDALSNYITALGFADQDLRFNKYWPADMHVIGKDILRFHAGIWIGMLLSAGLEIPKSIGVHGFITSEGHKMSKSLGNVVDPFEVIKRFGTDAFRFYLAREVPTGDDGDFSNERFASIYESDLANNFGNLVGRVLAMLDKYNDGKTVELANFKFEKRSEEVLSEYADFMNNFDLKKALDKVFLFLDELNTYLEKERPWKNGDVSVLMNVLEAVRRVTLLLWPFIPESIAKVWKSLQYEPCFNLKKDWIDTLDSGAYLEKTDVLFPKG